jgi:hypothetical protein
MKCPPRLQPTLARLSLVAKEGLGAALRGRIFKPKGAFC